jgi:hypothetical protein
MSDEEERVEPFPSLFGDKLVENRPSTSWSDVEAFPSQESPSDSDESASTPILLSPSRAPTMSTTEINTGDGVMVEISTTPRTTQATSLGGTMFRKEDRAKLSMEKRTELFDKIVLKKLDTKFTELSISLTDVKKLDDTYNIAMLVDRVCDHFIKYDLHGVFNIVDVSDPETNPTVNKALGSLFAAYSTISEDEVALSNEWYRCWAVSGEYETNLRLSMDFLEQNTSDSLFWESALKRIIYIPRCNTVDHFYSSS